MEAEHERQMHASPFSFHPENPEGIAPESLARLVKENLAGCDDGELFIECRENRFLAFDDGCLKQASRGIRQGFGLRAVAGEAVGYVHGDRLREKELRQAGAALAGVRQGFSGSLALPPQATNQSCYEPDNPLEHEDVTRSLEVLHAIDSYARAQDSLIRQVSLGLLISFQEVEILRPDGFVVRDRRPLVRLNVQVIAQRGDRRESGGTGGGGRFGLDEILQPEFWKATTDEAVRRARVNLDSRPAPAGEYPVVLGSGWAGVLLHEAVGHGLEGDFNRRGLSTFSGRIGERVASPGVTVIDDGTLARRRGSLSVDDEGTPSARNCLIEDGILVGYMQDRQNARLMGQKATGNGRRESYEHLPMPRMTNTFMLAGEKSRQELLAAVDYGVYAVDFGGGQVDITSGQFVFNCTEAYLIEKGKITAPLSGAMLIGSGPQIMKRISMIGNDFALDTGVGTCGKDGQGVPVGVGQPSLLVDRITVGGTAV